MRFYRHALLSISTLIVTALIPASAAPQKQPRVAPQQAPDLRESEDVANRIFAAKISKARVTKFTVTDIPETAFSSKPFEKNKPPEKSHTSGKIHPLLQRWLESRPAADIERIVISFRDDMRIPRFPEPANERRDSATNRRAAERADQIVSEIRAKRAEGYQRLQFWLVRALLVRMPIGSVPKLAERSDVTYLEPQQTEDKPPQNDVRAGRGRLNSDPYFNVGLPFGFIGLLDTGMLFTHVQFNSPSHIDFRRDCVNGGADCNTGTLNVNDDCWNHGTSSAAIITANARQGAAFRGVTEVTLDSFKVYPSTFNGTNCTGGLDTAAAIRGFEQAVRVLDRVIVAEMQGSGNHLSSLCTAADNAFDSGAVVIAANGNNGPNAGTVNTPASGHRVIGIGNFDVQTLAQINSQSRGPTSDNRFKPDVQAPTNTNTASTGCPFGQSCAQSNTALRVFGGTSGATPYGAGAAALLRNWLRGTSFSIDPGQVYAQIILSGQQPFPFNNTSGAGPLRLPTDGWAWWGKVNVSDGQTINIPIGVSGSPNRVDAAIWWPEYAFQIFGMTIEPHNDIDLSIIDPSSAVRGSSVSVSSVFERARASGSIPLGTWTVQIRGFNVPFAPQTVYWAAAAHRQ